MSFSVTQTLLECLRKRTQSFWFDPWQSAWLHIYKEGSWWRHHGSRGDGALQSCCSLHTHCRCDLLLGRMLAALKLPISSCLHKHVVLFVESRALALLVFELEVPTRDNLFGLSPGRFLKISCLFPTYAETLWSLTHRPLKTRRTASALPDYLSSNVWVWIGNVVCNLPWSFWILPLFCITPSSLGLWGTGILLHPLPLWTSLL